MKIVNKHLPLRYFLYLLLAVSLVSCSDNDPEVPEPEPVIPTPDPDEEKPVAQWTDITASPDEWDNQKRADISYQLLVYSFADSDGDKCGDLKGLIQKLDYIDQMGVSAIWLSPIRPAMSYHGYDVTDYTAINEKFGTESDFSQLITEAHSRGIKVYLDYVMNHTGKDHPWC